MFYTSFIFFELQVLLMEEKTISIAFQFF